MIEPRNRVAAAFSHQEPDRCPMQVSFTPEFAARLREGLNLRTGGRGGGLLIGPTHHVQLDTPMENFWSMVRAVADTPYSAVG